MNQAKQYPPLAPAARGGNVIRTFAIAVCIAIMMWAGIVAAVVAR